MNMIRINQILIAGFLLVGILFVTTIPASASNNLDSFPQKQVTFSKEPISNEAVLYDRAKNGETDLFFDQSFMKNLTFNEELAKEFYINNYVTTEKIKEIKELGQKGDSAKEESYVTTIFTDLSPKSTTSSGSTYLEQPSKDSSVSVTCTLRVYYSYRTDLVYSGNIPVNWYSAKLDRVQSKWTINDSQISIRNGFVRGTAYGKKVTSFDPHKEGALITHRGTASGEYSLISNPNPGTNYNYYPNWNDWINVYPDATHVGGQADITIHRNPTGSSWNFSYPLKVNYNNFPN
ncbi:hypothetical protein [Syntrophomonas zehnderi]|uniref:hypothetical protein n=1 Tax=Syntrophomonas zehnderi TaxID=404335 RepID=UPI0012F962CD|nr:hypothetical protein [Syntrophomonas zehnderi]